MLKKVALKAFAKVIARRKPLSFAQKQALKKAQLASAAARRKLGYNSTVLRLQNAKGQGPLMKRVVPPKGISSSKHKPFPVQPQHSKNIKRLKASTGLDFEVLKFDKQNKFGFASKKQAETWFNKKELDWYSKRGFKISKVNNVKITDSTKNQLVFKEISKKESRAIEKEMLKKYGIK